MNTTNTSKVTITVSRTTHQRLKETMSYGDTFDSKISELLTKEEVDVQ